MPLVIPAGYSHCMLGFAGVAVPTGAAITFGVANDTDRTPLLIAGSVRDAWTDHLAENCVSSLTLSMVRVKNGPNDDGPFAELGASVEGTIIGAGEAPMVSVLCQKVTAFGGRKGRGRFYHPGVPADSVNTDGQLADTVSTTWTTDLVAFLDDLEADDNPMVLLHGDATTPYPVTALLASNQVATQRRRNRR